MCAKHLTDFYFAYNLPYDLFEQIVRNTLEERGAGGSDLPVSFNPELAPQNMLFEQAMLIEKMPPQERRKHEARLQEIKVVLDPHFDQRPAGVCEDRERLVYHCRSERNSDA